MAPSGSANADWLRVARRAAEAARHVLERFQSYEERAVEVGLGAGGDRTLAIDRAVEDAVFEELEAGPAARVVSEERGEFAIGGGGPTLIVVDPIDGSLNAKRGLPPYGLSIAIADGDAMADVQFAYVCELSCGEEWWAARGGGAFCEGRRLETEGGGQARLEILGVESAQPPLVQAGAEQLVASEAARLRMIGSIALSLCYVAGHRFDGMLSLGFVRSVDAAAGQLIVREAGGAVSFLDAGKGALDASLSLEMRSRVVAGRTEGIAADLVALSSTA